MNAERPPDTLAQFTKVFAYRPNAIVPHLIIGWAAVVVAFGFLFWAWVWFEALTGRLALLLSLPVALMSAITLYLWIVAKTAMLVVTEHGLVYSDRWVKRALLWSEVSKVTRFAIQSKKGRGIVLKLGVKALGNWQELLNIARELSDAQILVEESPSLRQLFGFATVIGVPTGFLTGTLVTAVLSFKGLIPRSGVFLMLPLAVSLDAVVVTGWIVAAYFGYPSRLPARRAPVTGAVIGGGIAALLGYLLGFGAIAVGAHWGLEGQIATLGAKHGVLQAILCGFAGAMTGVLVGWKASSP